jgi:hypothetical protein
MLVRLYNGVPLVYISSNFPPFRNRIFEICYLRTFASTESVALLQPTRESENKTPTKFPESAIKIEKINL